MGYTTDTTIILANIWAMLHDDRFLDDSQPASQTRLRLDLALAEEHVLETTWLKRKCSFP